MHYCIKKQCALTGEKPCINKAIHALLMHDNGTFIMIAPGPQIAAVMRCVLPGPKTSIVRGNCPRDICEKAKQNSSKNNAKCSKCFQF